MPKTSKDCCPNCKTKFYVGDLPTLREADQMKRTGVVNLGGPVPEVTCPKCETKLKVACVRMGNYFSVIE